MKSAARRSLLLAISAVLCSTTAAQAYGPLGHEIVGAIADEQLAGTPTAAKIAVILDGFSLEKAAVIADEIKGWDKKGVDDPRSFHYSAHRQIDRQLRDFLAGKSANARFQFNYAFASLVSLHRRSSGASAKIPRRHGWSQ
jgi:hypothetical protein